jgi:hypothetical protein
VPYASTLSLVLVSSRALPNEAQQTILLVVTHPRSAPAHTNLTQVRASRPSLARSSCVYCVMMGGVLSNHPCSTFGIWACHSPFHKSNTAALCNAASALPIKQPCISLNILAAPTSPCSGRARSQPLRSTTCTLRDDASELAASARKLPSKQGATVCAETEVSVDITKNSEGVSFIYDITQRHAGRQ